MFLWKNYTFLLYRNYRKSSEAHCDQHNQEVATQRDIQCNFQLLYEPVNENTYFKDMEEEIFYRLPNTFFLCNFKL